MSWHGYIGIENLALNASQKATLITALRALGNQTHTQPHLISQFRARLDGNAAIFEAEFADDDLTTFRVRQYLANVFGVNVSSVTATTSQTQYGPMLTLSRLGTAYLRMVLFGGVGSTWPESREACGAYLAANAEAWDGPAEPVAVPMVTVFGRIIPAYTTSLGERIWDALPETWRSRITGA